jgi:NADPH:quinone reductase-like Zn-dependent oxidoreductase
MTTMRAAVRNRYGPPAVVEVMDVPRPVPTGDQLLVSVRAASVNRADLDNLYPRWQFMRLFLGLRRPRTRALGEDVAGVVESVGPGVTRFRPGDEVFSDLFVFGQGAYAEYVCAPQAAFATMPAGMSFEEAATLPHSAVLAVQGLRLRNGRTIGPGDKVLICGASGNVGPFAVQIAKARGAEVTGVASSAKVDFVRSLGADHVIDYETTDYTRTGDRYNWVLDVEAHHSLFRWRHALRPKGVYAALGGSAGWFLRSVLLGPFVSLATGKQIGVMLWWKPFKTEDVETLKELIAAGDLKPVIDRSFPLSEVADALRYVDEGRPRGKVVITV